MFEHPALEVIGPLKVAKKAARSPNAPHIVFFHGYGANAYDLFPLSSELQVKKEAHWYFPEGTMKVDLGGGFTGSAWFAINQKALERAVTRGEPLDFSNYYPPGLDHARDKALSMLASLNISPEELVLGGFSQGGMLALETALHLPEPPRGLVLFSSALANQIEWEERAKKFKDFRFFQSHGREDSILPFEGGTQLKDTLESAGWNSSWQEFSGAHEIPRTVIKAAQSYLNDVLA